MKTPLIFLLLVLPLASSTLKRNRNLDIFQGERKNSIDVGEIYDEIGDVPGLTASKAYSGGNPDVLTSDAVSHIKRVTSKDAPGLVPSKADGGGEPFSDHGVLKSIISKGYQVSIQKIVVRAGSIIDQIAFVLATGDKLVHGGTGGNETSLVLNVNTESLIKVEYQFAPFALLSWIKFTTSEGRTIEGGTINEKEEIKAIRVPKGFKIVGMHGSKGKFIDSLGFYILAPSPIGKPTGKPTSQQQLSDRFIGCYKDTAKDRDLPKRMRDSSTDTCLQACAKAGYTFIGRQYHNECWCGSTYGKYARSKDCKSCLSDKAYYGSNANCVFSTSVPATTNLALKGTASQSSTVYDAVASKAIDGNTNGDWKGNSVTHTKIEKYPWWTVKLSGDAFITKVVVWNRLDCCSERLSKSLLYIYNGSKIVAKKFISDSKGVKKFEFDVNVVGNAVTVKGIDAKTLQLAEVQVFGKPTSQQQLSGRFIGCYKDTIKDRDLPKFMPNSGTDTCLQACAKAGYKFIGRQYHNQCWCGSTYGKYGPSKDCKSCSSDKAYYGGNVNCVFSTSSTKPLIGKPTSPPSTARPCGGGNRGNGLCADGRCCSRFGYCGKGAAFCGEGIKNPKELMEKAKEKGPFGKAKEKGPLDKAKEKELFEKVKEKGEGKSRNSLTK